MPDTSRPQPEMPTPQNAWLPPNGVPTRLILLRHGVTDHTLARVFAGRSNLDLADEGRRQAARAAERIESLGPVDAVISSPLARTRQTAQAVADRFGLDVEASDGFVETDFGGWDGLSFAEVQRQWPDLLRAWMSDSTVAPPSGESFDQVAERVAAARDAVLAAHRGRRVVVVSHVTPIKMLVRLALDAPASALYRMFLAPASLSIIDYFDGGAVTVLGFNDTSYL